MQPPDSVCRVLDCQLSAQPRFLSPALETHAQEVSASPLAATLSKEHAQSWVRASVSPLTISASRCHCCMHTSLLGFGEHYVGPDGPIRWLALPLKRYKRPRPRSHHPSHPPAVPPPLRSSLAHCSPRTRRGCLRDPSGTTSGPLGHLAASIARASAASSGLSAVTQLGA